MTVRLTKEALDLGIVTRDHDAMVRFYRDTLGLPHVRSVEGSLGSMSFFGVGSSMLKLIRPDEVPPVGHPQGEPTDATGPRYFTLRVSNLDQVVADCEGAHVPVVWPKKPLGTSAGWVALVADPDGNLVEFVQDA